MKQIQKIEIFDKITSLKPDEIIFLDNKNFEYSLKIKINRYIVYLNFNNEKKGECFIYYNNNYYFSLTDKLSIIFEYLYLIVSKTNSSEILNNAI